MNIIVNRMNTRRSFNLLVGVAVACSCLPLRLGAAGEPTWRAGAASVVITPAEYMWMAGYGGRDRPADSKLTDLYAKALVLQDAAGDRGVLITLDIVGIDAKLAALICADLEKGHGIPRASVAICCSHTHSGPVIGRNLEPLHYRQLDQRQRQRVEEYAEFLRAQVADAVGQAMEGLQPATLAYGASHATFGVNRRNNTEANVPQLREANQLVGPVDHQAPFLVVRNAEDEPLAVAFGYACHATVLSDYAWCGDYPGYAQEALQQALPGCVALFWAGCGGDINPLPRRRVELARQYGQQLADAVLQGMEGELQSLSPVLQCSYREIPLPLADAGGRSDWETKSQSSNRFEQARAAMILSDWDAGRPPRKDYPYPIAMWRLGDAEEKPLRWFFLGGEVVVDYAIAIKAQVKGAAWVTGYSNDVMAYIPSRRVLREGGYEGGGAMVYYGLPAHWAPDLEGLILAETRRQAEPAVRR